MVNTSFGQNQLVILDRKQPVPMIDRTFSLAVGKPRS